jgi:outer membrane biosynthesis protein TonB
MKKHILVLITVLLIAGAWAAWALWPRPVEVPVPGTAQKDSLLRGEAVFWPEQRAYFRIRNGRWEKSTNVFDSPFIPVATEEAGQMLYAHFNIAANEVHAPAAPTNPTPQPPVESPKNAEPKPTPEKQVVINAAEIQKKSAAEQKAAEEKARKEAAAKAEAEKKKKAEGDKNKPTAGGNAADEYWSKVKLIGGKYKGTKEEAKALWDNQPKVEPKEDKNVRIRNAVLQAK